MDMKGKSKILDLNAKRSFGLSSGKDPKKVITSNKAKGSGVSMPRNTSKKPSLNAKYMK